MLSYGGTLVVTNWGGTFGAGDSFRLYSATAYSGSFAVLKLPPLEAGLAWTNRLALDGSLAVVALPSSPPVLTAVATPTNTLVLSWPASESGFHLQGQTNAPGLGLGTGWFNIPGTNSPVVLPFGSGNGSVFYRLVAP